MSEIPNRLAAFLAGPVAREETCWRPSVDVYRTPDGWLLKFDLAGVRLEDVNVHLRGRSITVSGFRRDWALEHGCSHYMMEISYNRFERTIELPCELTHARTRLEYREGLLLIRVSDKEGS